MKAFMTAFLSFIIVVVIGFGISFISRSEASEAPTVVAFLKQYWLWILGASGSLLLVWALWKLPKLQVNPSIITDPKERFTLENEARKTLAQIIGGLVILAGLYFTWQTVQSTRKTVELNQESIKNTSELTRKSLELTQEGQVTERFTRAIDQLGKKESLEIRLGGIYALDRIARDSEKDHWQIMEVLTTYVRENAPWKKQQSASQQISTPSPKKDLPPKLAADIQAILTVIGRRTRTYGKGEVQHLNLNNVDIRGADLGGANLQGASLVGAHLEGAYLGGTHLERANLFGTHLKGANLIDAHLEGAYLGEANLEGAYLYTANLEGDIGLTIEQLSQVKTLYGAKLDESLMKQIQRDYPHLLEEPK